MAKINKRCGIPVTGRKSALRHSHCFDGITEKEMLEKLREHSRVNGLGKGSRNFKTNLFKKKSS